MSTNLSGKTAYSRIILPCFRPGFFSAAAMTSTRTVNSDADQFRKQAKECRQLTAGALKPVVKAFWLRLAEERLKLAQAADKPAMQR
jgi:hypothetical protein